MQKQEWNIFRSVRQTAFVFLGVVFAGAAEGALIAPDTVGSTSGGDARSSTTGYFESFRLEPLDGKAANGDLSIWSPILSDPVAGLPGFRRQQRPEDAHVKIGQLYLSLLSVSGSVLYTDNADLEPSGGKGDTISIFRLSAGAFYQFTENLQFGATGRLVYLPGKGEFGIAGFGIEDPLDAFTRDPLFLAQLRYAANLNEWDLEVFNRFSVYAIPSTSEGLGFEFDDEDRIGRHVYRDPFTVRAATESALPRSSITGASAARLLPTETQLTLAANRVYWWHDSAPRLRHLPTRRDRGSISLASERENVRFKPFANYQIDRYNSNPWTHQARGGLQGPLSDYLTARAEAGYFWADDLDRDGWLWLVRLGHTPRPFTYHEISYRQSLRDPFRDLDETWGYLIRQTLNSTVEANASFDWTRFEFLDRPGTKGREWGAYAGLRAAVISEGGIAIRGGYEDRRYDDRTLGSRSSWVARTTVTHRSLQADLHYRYLDRASQLPNIFYQEHVLMFTLTKFF